jgi:capsid protein
MYREHPAIQAVRSSTRAGCCASRERSASTCSSRSGPGHCAASRCWRRILTKLRDIGNYQDAVLLRQQIANLFVAFLTRKLGPEDDDTDPLTGKSIEGSLDKPHGWLSPGLLQELEDGQDVKFANPPEAGTTYSDYLRTELLGVAAGRACPTSSSAATSKR